jgi:hypothetical protein
MGVAELEMGSDSWRGNVMCMVVKYLLAKDFAYGE